MLHLEAFDPKGQDGVAGTAYANMAASVHVVGVVSNPLLDERGC